MASFALRPFTIHAFDPRRWGAFLALLVFLLCFMPAPLYFSPNSIDRLQSPVMMHFVRAAVTRQQTHA